MKETRQVRRKRSDVDDAEPHAGAAVQLQGVTPAQQARSGATFLALLQAGREALERGSMDDMTVGDIARSAGTSVGAFYGRFENKEAFFSAVQEMTVAQCEVDLHVMFDALEAEDADVARMLQSISTFWVHLFRENRGLYRAAFKHATALPGVWTPFKRLGYHGSELIVAHVLPRLHKMGLDVEEIQIKMAMQFVNGLLINSTINDPGPVRLDDQEMEVHIARFLCTFLGVPPPAAQVATRKPRARKTT